MHRHASMRRIHRLDWSEVRSAGVPVAGTGWRRGKTGHARSIASRNIVATAISRARAPLAHALAGRVESSTASITQSGITSDISKSSIDPAIDWPSIGVGLQDTVDLLQPSVSAIVLGRVFSTNLEVSPSDRPRCL